MSIEYFLSIILILLIYGHRKRPKFKIDLYKRPES